MAIFTSNTYEGRYLQLSITESVNAVLNTSTLTWTLQSIGGSEIYYSLAATTVTINGTTVYSKELTHWQERVFPAAKGSTSGTITVAHDSDGKKSITVGFSTSVYYYTAKDYGGSMILTNIDRTAPTISASATVVSSSSITIKGSANTSCDSWDYSLDGGSSWTNFSTTNGTSASKTISDLTPNTTYQIKVRARKKSNGLYGASAVTNIKTIGASVLNSADELVIDVSSPSFNINWTVYNKSYTHSLAIKSGSTTILTITGLIGSTGTNNKTISLTSTQRTTILNAMASTGSLSATYVLTTYSGSTQIGSTSQTTGSITTSEKTSAPTFTAFTYADSNATTVNVTGNDQLFVQTESLLQIICTAATAKNGASISKYSASIGEKTIQSTATTFSFGIIPDSGNLTLTVSAVDSRGYKTSVSKTITVIDYQAINFDSYAIRRENNVDDTIQLEFSGKISPITVGSADKNGFVSAKYRTKLSTDTSWSSYTTMTDVTSDSSAFEFDNDNWISLPSSDAYYVQLYVSDKLSYKTVTLYVSKGQPLVSFREQKVGINTNEPQFALDVNGDIAMNGYRVQGYVGQVAEGTDLNNVLTSGIYYIPLASSITNHPQSNSAAILEVIEVIPTFIIQRLTCVDGKIYSRGKYNTTWYDWT